MAEQNPEWETVTTDSTVATERLKILGGWLYRDTMRNDPYTTCAMVFVPEPPDAR